MSTNHIPFRLFVGVDIADKSASIAWTRQAGQIEATLDIQKTSKGIRRLQKRLLSIGYPSGQVVVVMEATGVYWMQFAEAMHKAGFAISVVNPMQVRRFAQATLKRDKTDPIDAQTITEFAITLTPILDLWTPPPPIYEELHQRLTQRDALIKMILQEKNRLHALKRRILYITLVQQRSSDTIKFLQAQVQTIDTELLDLLENGEWSENAKRLLSIKCVGVVTTGWLLVATLNFTTCETAEQLCSFAGLVPRHKQSGTSLQTRPRIGHAGHARLRRAMFIATMSALQHNPPIRDYYQRLQARGKKRKVALVAAARKLTHICWACVKYGRTFDPDYSPKTPRT